jgi:hypothetical protein
MMGQAHHAPSGRRCVIFLLGLPKYRLALNRIRGCPPQRSSAGRMHSDVSRNLSRRGQPLIAANTSLVVNINA